MTATPHDALFRATFSVPEHAAGLLRTALDPRLVARIDWSSLTLIGDSFVDEDLRAQHADLLFSVRIGEHIVCPYLLLEHKSTPEHSTVFQLLKYVLSTWDHRRHAPRKRTGLPPVVPVVVYHGLRRWTAPTEFSDLVDIPPALECLRDTTPRFRFILVDLSTLDDAALRTQGASPAVRLTLLALTQARRSRDLQALLAGWITLLRELLREPGGEAVLGQVLSYLYEVRGRADFGRLDLQALNFPESKAIMQSMADHLRAQGRQQGRQQGLQQGHQGLFLRLLRRKFPQVSPARLAQAEAADIATIDRWSDQLLTATTVDEVFA